MRFVRVLVLGETHIAINAEQAFLRVHLLDVFIKFRHPLHDIGDERGEFLAQDVVGRLVVEEPWPVVVFGEAFEKLEQGGDVHSQDFLRFQGVT